MYWRPSFVYVDFLLFIDGLAVMSVDLGSQFMKIAIVKVCYLIISLLLRQKSTLLVYGVC